MAKQCSWIYLDYFWNQNLLNLHTTHEQVGGLCSFFDTVGVTQTTGELYYLLPVQFLYHASRIPSQTHAFEHVFHQVESVSLETTGGQCLTDTLCIM